MHVKDHYSFPDLKDDSDNRIYNYVISAVEAGGGMDMDGVSRTIDMFPTLTQNAKAHNLVLFGVMFISSMV